ncbi:tRNA1(Val) (adenine(37)-N6)-methyltransferase [Syntrophomonas erecta]
MSKAAYVNRDETLDDLILGDLRIIQSCQGYRFSLDPILLGHFARVEGVQRIVDLGTGSGVIALLLSWRAPQARIIGLEIQKSMVDRARRSIKLNGLQERLEVIEEDINQVNQVLPPDSMDLVVSNPPFRKVGEGKQSSDPEKAVARHEIKVTLEGIVKAAGYLLKPGGSFCLIQRADRLEEIGQLLHQYQLYPLRLRNIHSFIDREAKLVMVEGVKQRHNKLIIMPPLIIYSAPGIYGDELRLIYDLPKID